MTRTMIGSHLNTALRHWSHQLSDLGEIFTSYNNNYDNDTINGKKKELQPCILIIKKGHRQDNFL